MEGEPREAGCLQLLQELLRQRHAVGVDDGLAPHRGDATDDCRDVGVHERVATGNRDAVEVAEPGKDVEIGLDLLERLVLLDVLPVAALAREVAGLRRLDPGDGVVG